jgi:hypothetical protein
MLDASLERPKIFFAHYHVHVAGIVIDQCPAQRRAIGDGGLVGLAFFGSNSTAACPGFSAPPFPCSHTRAVFPAAHCKLNPFGMFELL